MSTRLKSLNVDDYSLSELRFLFGQGDRQKVDLKAAKKIVNSHHPDKSRLGPEYFVFYNAAYKRLANEENTAFPSSIHSAAGREIVVDREFRNIPVQNEAALRAKMDAEFEKLNNGRKKVSAFDDLESRRTHLIGYSSFSAPSSSNGKFDNAAFDRYLDAQASRISDTIIRTDETFRPISATGGARGRSLFHSVQDDPRPVVDSFSLSDTFRYSDIRSVYSPDVHVRGRVRQPRREDPLPSSIEAMHAMRDAQLNGVAPMTKESANIRDEQLRRERLDDHQNNMQRLHAHLLDMDARSAQFANLVDQKLITHHRV